MMDDPVVGAVYNGGFAVAKTFDEMIGIIENTRNVNALLFNNMKEAYEKLVQEHVDRNIQAGTLPIFPRNEDWKDHPFFITPNVNTFPVTFRRSFVLVNMNYAGVYDNIVQLVNDFFYDRDLCIIEAQDEMDAVSIINNFYKAKVYQVGPYINTKIPFAMGPFPKNVLIYMPYIKLLENVTIPKEIEHLSPLYGNSSGDEKANPRLEIMKNSGMLQIAEIVNN